MDPCQSEHEACNANSACEELLAADPRDDNACSANTLCAALDQCESGGGGRRRAQDQFGDDVPYAKAFWNVESFIGWSLGSHPWESVSGYTCSTGGDATAYVERPRLDTSFTSAGQGLRYVDRYSKYSGLTGDFGGAMYIESQAIWGDVQVSVSFATFEGNAATYQGGAIHMLGCDATISHSSFIGNTAALHGGAIYASAFSVLNISHVTFRDNVVGQTFVRSGEELCREDDETSCLAVGCCTWSSCSDTQYTTEATCIADLDCNNDNTADDTCVWTAEGLCRSAVGQRPCSGTDPGVTYSARHRGLYNARTIYGFQGDSQCVDPGTVCADATGECPAGCGGTAGACTGTAGSDSGGACNAGSEGRCNSAIGCVWANLNDVSPKGGAIFVDAGHLHAHFVLFEFNAALSIPGPLAGDCDGGCNDVYGSGGAVYHRGRGGMDVTRGHTHTLTFSYTTFLGNSAYLLRAIYM